MKLYRCDLCGRVFHERIPHICIHGNYRKRNLTFTEFEDVDNEYIKKSEVDVKEKSFPKVPQGSLILEKPQDPKIEFLINWEQARIDAAIAAMGGILANPDLNINFETDEDGVVLGVTSVSVKLSDALIAELKKEKNEQP